MLAATGGFGFMRGAVDKRGWMLALGVTCILVWNQCVLYNQRISVDAGMTTVITSAIRCAFIVVLLAIALGPLRGRIPRWVGVASVACMSAAGVALLLSNLFSSEAFMIASVICAAVGVTWGGGMWIVPYARLGLRSAFVCSALAMGLSALAGCIVCLLPWTVSTCLGIILPVVSYACYCRAEDAESGQRTAVPADLDCSFPRLSASALRVGLGIAAFSVALGIARGFPDGDALVLPEMLRPVQFLVVLVAAGVFLWWSARPAAKPRAGVLWACYIAATVLSVFLVSSAQSALVGWAAVLLSAVNLLQVLMLWLLACDVARNSARPPFVALALFWLVHLFFRELGRFLIIAFPAQTYESQTLLSALVVGLLAASVALLLAGRTPSGALFFSGYGEGEEVAATVASAVASNGGELGSAGVANAPARPRESVAPCVAGTPATQALSSPAVGPVAVAASAAAVVPGESTSEWLQGAFGLTKRECDVAQLLALGKSAAAIADRLVLSKETVRSYTKAIYAKMDVHSKDELAELIEGHAQSR